MSYCGALSLCRSVLLLPLRFNHKRGGRSDAKTYDHLGCCSARPGLDGALGQRAKPAARCGEPARAGAERDADPPGGVPRIRPPLPARIALGLRPGALLVRSLLVGSANLRWLSRSAPALASPQTRIVISRCCVH